MSEPAPSWLTEENISVAQTAAHNPVVQQAAVAAAQNEHVQNYAKKEMEKQISNKLNTPLNPKTEEEPSWMRVSESHRDVESGGGRQSSKSEYTGYSDFYIDPVTLKDMQRYHLILRILYIGVSVFLSAAAVLSLQNQDDFAMIFFSFYVFFFSALLCCFEFALSMVSRIIAENFGFMYTLTGRFFFLLLVGFMAWPMALIGKIAMCTLYAIGLFHFFIMCKFPRFEEYLRKKHYHEGSQ